MIPISARPLFVFAHRGEAHAFLHRPGVRPIDFHFGGFHESPEGFILITGEGRERVLERLAGVCGAYRERIDRIVHIGVAAALRPGVGLERIYRIRTIYGADGDGVQRTRFATGDAAAGCDVISLHRHRVDDATAERLAAIAPLADREAWACASVAALFDLPLRVCKLAVERSGPGHDCRRRLERAADYSARLRNHFIETDGMVAAGPALAELP